ncbi:F-box protein CPR1-like isoform X2 [Macadamia integrifolia]|uniref:F-box protein CPR1-like isoform X2 n=1 Tax=Macadamia integrifolia TaxID=60698 RepID=UPI001C4F0473|nr:F-box protein CPR1-like isoform X2 [Macadamia integrifolia]
MAEFTEKITEEEAIPTKNLPEVLIADILSRLPVKSLLKFRCVCKTWCALIADPAFVKEHLNRSLASNSNLSLIFRRCALFSVDLDTCEQRAAVELDHPLKSPHLATEVLGSCNGLLCISNSDEDILLWNPSIRRHHKLPITPIEFPVRFDSPRLIVYGLGYDPTTDDYKLVRVVQFYGDSEYSCDSEVKVYSLRTNSWRRIRDMPYHLSYERGFGVLNNSWRKIRDMPYHLSYKRGYGVLANYALHWVAMRETGRDTASTFIVSFDLQDEYYREIPLPDFVDDEFHMTVGVLGGQLCLLCNFFRVRVEVWVMKEYGVRDSWLKQFSIEQPDVISSFMFVRPICYSKNGDVILDKDSEAPLLLYDSLRERVRNLRIRGAPDRMETEICVGSLVPLNAKDGTEQPAMMKKHRKHKKRRFMEQRAG